MAANASSSSGGFYRGSKSLRVPAYCTVHFGTFYTNIS